MFKITWGLWGREGVSLSWGTVQKHSFFKFQCREQRFFFISLTFTTCQQNKFPYWLLLKKNKKVNSLLQKSSKYHLLAICCNTAYFLSANFSFAVANPTARMNKKCIPDSLSLLWSYWGVPHAKKSKNKNPYQTLNSTCSLDAQDRGGASVQSPFLSHTMPHRGYLVDEGKCLFPTTLASGCGKGTPGTHDQSQQYS